MASLAQAPVAALAVHDWVRAEPADPPPTSSQSPSPFPATPPPPSTLVLAGELRDQGECLGVYCLLDAKVYGGPVWQHRTRDRFLAKHKDGSWLVQQNKNVGHNDYCHMRLSDPSNALPHLSAAAWEEFDSDAQLWVRAHVFQCIEDASGELSSLHLKREKQAVLEKQAAKERAQQERLAAENGFYRPIKSYMPPKKKPCRECLEDPLKGGSRCFACDPR